MTFITKHITLALTAALALPCAAQEWYRVAISANGSASFVDMERVRVDGETVRIWQREDLAEPRIVDQSLLGILKPRIAQELNYHVVDCQKQSTKITSAIFKSDKGEILGSRNLNEDSVAPQSYPPGSVGDLFIRFTCDEARALHANSKDVPRPVTTLPSSGWRRTASLNERTHAIAEDSVKGGSEENADLVYFLDRADYFQSLKAGLFVASSVVNTWLGNCRQRELRQLTSTYFDSRGQVLFKTITRSPQSFTVPGGSVGEQTLNEACRIAARSVASKQAVTSPTAPTPQSNPSDAKNSSSGKPAAEERQFSTGTAWYSASGYFVTAYHVIQGGEAIRLVGSDMKPLPARIVAADEKNDVAILSADLEGRIVRPIPLSPNTATLGSRVFTIGYPHSSVLGISPKVTSGEVSGNLPRDPTKILISVPIQSGNSGGPLVNMNGEAVGLVIEKLSAPQVYRATGDLTENTNFALKSRYIEALIDDLPKRTVMPLAKPSGKNLEDWVSAYKDSIYFVFVRTEAKAK